MKGPNNINDLVAHVFCTTRLIRERAQKTCKSDPFSALQLETLFYVESKGNPTMKDISGYLCVTPPSATSVVDKLVIAKKLERITDPKDRRIVRLNVTAKGKNEAEKWYAEKIERMKKMFSVLTESERIEFTRILTKISEQNS